MYLARRKRTPARAPRLHGTAPEPGSSRPGCRERSSGPGSHRHRLDPPQLRLGRPARGLDRQAVQDRGDVRAASRVGPPGRSPSCTARSNRSRNAATVACRKRASSRRTGSASSPRDERPGDDHATSRPAPVAMHPDGPRVDRLGHGTRVVASRASSTNHSAGSSRDRTSPKIAEGNRLRVCPIR